MSYLYSLWDTKRQDCTVRHKCEKHASCIIYSSVYAGFWIPPSILQAIHHSSIRHSTVFVGCTVVLRMHARTELCIISCSVHTVYSTLYCHVAIASCASIFIDLFKTFSRRRTARRTRRSNVALVVAFVYILPFSPFWLFGLFSVSAIRLYLFSNSFSQSKTKRTRIAL